MLILDEEMIKSHYLMADAINDVKKILLDHMNGTIVNPHRTVIEYPEKHASVLYMPSSEMTSSLTIIKTVTIFPENAKKGKPTTQAVTLVTDTDEGNFRAMMDASYLTRLRTGALSATATELLSREDSKVLTAIGTGGMAFEQVLGMLAVREIDTMYLVNPTESKAWAFKEKLLRFGIREGINIEIETDVSKAVKKSDIICCSTRSLTPVFDGNDIKPGTHVNGVGSYLPHMREVDYEFIKRANKIVVDDLYGAKEEAGELIYAAQQADWSYDMIHGELKEVLAGKKNKRNETDEITFFKSVGSAYFDLAVARGVYEKAKEKNLGTKIKF